MLDKKTFKRSKMASVNYGLNILGKGDLVLKDKQWEIIRYITLEKRDVMAVLSTGCGKSLYTTYHRFHGKKFQHYCYYCPGIFPS